MAKEFDFRKIWWIASYPKSGNTWVRMFLDAYISGRKPELNDWFGRYVQGDMQHAHYQAICPWPLDKVPKSILSQLRPAMLLHLIACTPSKHVCLKTHDAKVDVDGVPRIPPHMTAGAVYLVRDPRDVAVSWSHHASCGLDRAVSFLGEGVSMPGNELNMFHLLKGWSEHVVSWISENEDVPTTVVRYEDLLVEPESQFTAILKALGFEKINKRRLRWAIRETSLKKLQEAEDKQGFKEKRGGERFFRQGEAGAWMDVLRPWHVSQIEHEHGDVMAVMGYELASITVEQVIAEGGNGNGQTDSPGRAGELSERPSGPVQERAAR